MCTTNTQFSPAELICFLEVYIFNNLPLYNKICEFIHIL